MLSFNAGMLSLRLLLLQEGHSTAVTVLTEVDEQTTVTVALVLRQYHDTRQVVLLRAVLLLKKHQVHGYLTLVLLLLINSLAPASKFSQF